MYYCTLPKSGFPIIMNALVSSNNGISSLEKQLVSSKIVLALLPMTGILGEYRSGVLAVHSKLAIA